MSGHNATTMDSLFEKAERELIEPPFETETGVNDWLDGEELRFGPDDDGDVLVVGAERDEDGMRYVGVLRPVGGEDEGKSYLQGVLLAADDQVALATELLGFDPNTPADEVRADAARTAADILRSSTVGSWLGGSSNGQITALEVIALAAWIADGDLEVALAIEAQKYGDDL